MRELGHKHIRAPVPHHEYTTRKVLVMERFSGLRVDRFDEIKANGIDGESKLVDGLRAWFQCVVFYGFFHGDVHAGNLMLLDDDTIGFLDFGIVGRFDDKARYLVTDYMIAFASGNYKRLAEIICEMAGTPRRPRHGRLRQGPRRDLPPAAHAVVRRGQLRRTSCPASSAPRRATRCGCRTSSS